MKIAFGYVYDVQYMVFRFSSSFLLFTVETFWIGLKINTVVLYIREVAQLISYLPFGSKNSC